MEIFVKKINYMLDIDFWKNTFKTICVSLGVTLKGLGLQMTPRGHDA